MYVRYILVRYRLKIIIIFLRCGKISAAYWFGKNFRLMSHIGLEKKFGGGSGQKKNFGGGPRSSPPSVEISGGGPGLGRSPRPGGVRAAT